MEKDDLVKRLNRLGFTLFETDSVDEPNKTLADILKSSNIRYLEGFPVILKTVAEQNRLDLKRVSRLLKTKKQKSILISILILSLALYKALNQRFRWTKKIEEFLPDNWGKQFSIFIKKLKNSDAITISNQTFSCPKLKNIYNNYTKNAEQSLDEYLSMKEKSDMEYSLSQLFSSKQKELIYKRIRGEKFTKTENEYYSRTVKKKITALSNPRLNLIAQKLLNS